MTVLALIAKYLGLAIPEGANAEAILKLIAAKFPDAAKLLQPAIALLDVPVDGAALAAALPPELLDIVQLHINSRRHAGDDI